MIEILFQLLKLVSLKIHSLSLSKPRSLSEEEAKYLLDISDICKVTKVYLEEITDIQEVYFFMKLCPRMNYFQVNFIHNINIESFVQDILIRINEDLRLLYLRISAADDRKIR